MKIIVREMARVQKWELNEDVNRCVKQALNTDLMCMSGACSLIPPADDTRELLDGTVIAGQGLKEKKKRKGKKLKKDQTTSC